MNKAGLAVYDAHSCLVCCMIFFSCTYDTITNWGATAFLCNRLEYFS